MKLNKLKELREQKGYTQLEFSLLIDINYKTYNRKEQGKTDFTVTELEKIYKILDVNPLELLD
ncbi:helix-turn-helix transcriptional regulator [Clostridioides difficile]|uniref:helix-turn-helix transcriptional regulator n=1 Tax=Clostridioides difficile TaxID=1496 RepID=UPI000B3D09ED|nr:helix-turn-helix transcriptional regulator [Clostridioides difficile]